MGAPKIAVSIRAWIRVPSLEASLSTFGRVAPMMAL
jgi:hypothetical protein